MGVEGRGGGRKGRWIFSQSGTANICPPPLGHGDTSPPSSRPPVFLPSLLRCGEAARAAAVGQAQSQNPPQEKKVSPAPLPQRCQRSRKFNSLERLGFAFLKPLRGGTRPSSKAQVHGKKRGSCQMIFVLSDDLGGGVGGRNPQNSSEQSPQTPLSRSYIFITFLFPGLTWQDFNCLHFRLKRRMSRVRAPRVLREGCGKSNASARHNLINT